MKGRIAGGMEGRFHAAAVCVLEVISRELKPVRQIQQRPAAVLTLLR